MTILRKRSVNDLFESSYGSDCPNYQPCYCNGINGYDGS